MDTVIREDIERGIFKTPPTPNENPNLTVSVKRIDQAGKKIYVKHNNTELHIASQQGDLASVKHILDEIDLQMVGSTLSGADFDAEVAKTQASVVNELGETALYIAAKEGHLEVVKELLKYSNKETLTRTSHLGCDSLHIAASHGHHAIVKLLLDHDVSLCQIRSKDNATPLITAASNGHTAVVNELLSKDPSLIYTPRPNGKNALHLAARSGHIETVKSLLEKDPQLARRSDKKGQTALHMAIKGASNEVVKLLLEADAAIVMLPDNSGLTALHVATKKKRVEIVNELLCLPDTNVNALTRDHKTALDIAKGLSLSEESADIRACLARWGAIRANKLIQPQDELIYSVTQIQADVQGIANEFRKLHSRRFNNDTNFVTAAVLFAAIAFAAIFTVPGGDKDDGMASVAYKTSFKIFFIFNAISLYAALAVVILHLSIRPRGGVNQLIWLCSVCTSVAFMAASYIVVGRKYVWVAVLITVLGVSVLILLFGTMMHHVVACRIYITALKERKTRF